MRRGDGSHLVSNSRFLSKFSTFLKNECVYFESFLLKTLPSCSQNKKFGWAAQALEDKLRILHLPQLTFKPGFCSLQEKGGCSVPGPQPFLALVHI